MNTPRPPESQRPRAEYSRHHHRSSSATNTTWNDWIDGGASRGSRPWLKIVLIIAALLVLGAIMVGLIIEMRPL